MLLDNKFATLPHVVAEGRRVIGNIERVSTLFLTKTVYAVLLAIVLLGEQRELSVSFYCGVAVIVGAVLSHTVLKLRGTS